MKRVPKRVFSEIFRVVSARGNVIPIRSARFCTTRENKGPRDNTNETRSIRAVIASVSSPLTMTHFRRHGDET